MSVFTKDTLVGWGKTVKVGDYSYGTPNVWQWGEGAKLKIGKFCSFSWDINIFLGGEHRSDWIAQYPFPVFFPEAYKIKGHPTTKGDVIIGNDVWVGFNVIILSGVTIGDGAVIGAGAVVSSNVEPYAIVVGNPAREVKKRFPPDVIKKLIEIRWWDWDIEKIKKNFELLCSNNLDEFFKNAQ